MDYSISRRSFLGASLAAWPVLRAIAARLPIVESEFDICVYGWPDICVTSYANRTMTATWGGYPLDTADDLRTWKKLTGRIGNATCELRVRSLRAKTFDVDWIRMCRPGELFVDNFLPAASFYYRRTPAQLNPHP